MMLSAPEIRSLSAQEDHWKMQAQKEVGSVCWGDLGKQEVSP